MRVGIIGLGSIGSRRARLLASFPQVDEMVVYDSDGGRVADFVLNLNAPITNAEGTQAIVPADDLDELLSLKPDAVFICTPAETHIDVATQCLNADIRGVFIEKPLSVSMEGIAELKALADEKHATVMVACNMRWAYHNYKHRDTVSHGIPRQGPSVLTLVSTQPLREWGPNKDAYRKGGIVLESAIHEIDLAYCTQGMIVGLEARGWKANNGPTAIPGMVRSQDAVTLTLRHANTGESIIYCDWSDVAWRARRAQQAGRNGSWSGDANTSDAMYVEEMKHFLSCVENLRIPCNTLDDAAHVLSWALRAKELAA